MRGFGKQSRRDIDPGILEGLGFPFAFDMSVVPAISGSTTGYDFWPVPVCFDTAGDGFALRLAFVNVFVGSLGTGGASGSNTFIIKKVDSAGNALVTIATIAIAYNVQQALVDLRDANNKGYGLYTGEQIRIDTGTLAGSLSINPSGIIFHFTAEAYGIRA